MKHWDELEEDASDRLWALLGTSVHYILNEASNADHFTEERLSAEFGGVVISGQSDNYHDKEIQDWKVTSVWSFLHGIKPEWVAQLNVYAWLWRQAGFEVEKLTINAILRDWQVGKRFEEGYPKVQFQSISIPAWPQAQTVEYIADRVCRHLLPAEECTPEEKWAAETTWACKKAKNKRASKVCATEEDAQVWIDSQKKPSEFVIEKRLGGNRRCESYCPVSAFCPYYKEDTDEPQS